MHHQKIGPRAEYRQQETLRIQESVSLTDKFRQLKTLTVELAHYNPGGVIRSSEVKYTVNLANAKSVFSFACPNSECVRGDFDLSGELAEAIAAHRTTSTGERVCQGWLNRATIDTVRCHHILRYKFSLGY